MRPYEHGGDIYGGGKIRLDFSVNTNPLGLPDGVARAIGADPAADSRYPDPHCRALRAALSARCGVAAERIVCGAGAAELIFRLCACLRPRRVLTAAPAFSEYGRCAALFGAALTEYPLRREDGFAPDGGFAAAVTPETDMVFLCQPNNPTGRLWEPSLLAATADACEKNGAYLVADECFIAFTRGASLLPLLADHPHLLILRAFTKLYAMAGLRLGYLLCHDVALAERIAAFGPEWSVSTVAQRAGLAALATPDWQARTLAAVEPERRRVAAGLAALGVTVYPTQANYLLCRAPRPVYEPLLERGILVRRCDTFRGLDENDFRVGLKMPAENNILIDTLEEVLHGKGDHGAGHHVGGGQEPADGGALSGIPAGRLSGGAL